MLRYRLVFGPLMVAAVIAVFWGDNQLDRLDISGTLWQKLLQGRTYLPSGLLMLSVFLLLAPLASRELCRIFVAKGVRADPAMMILAAVLGCLLTFVIPFRTDSELAIAIFASLMVLLFLVSLARYSWAERRTRGAVMVASATMFTVIYLGFLPGFFISIRRWHSAWVVLAIILVAKSCDVGAYFGGRAVGRHKLVPWLSPGKTWEGLLAGIAVSGLTAVLLVSVGNSVGAMGRWGNLHGVRVFERFDCPLWYACLGGALLGLVGQFGDLVASLFKRDAGLKDSGGSIPGFGGLIDVIDSAIVVAPVAYWLLMVMPHVS